MLAKSLAAWMEGSLSAAYLTMNLVDIKDDESEAAKRLFAVSKLFDCLFCVFVCLLGVFVCLFVFMIL